MITVTIKEKSWLAAIAARKLKSAKVAMVIGRTIYLHNTSREEFITNRRWLRHEIAHVKQYQRMGVFTFIIAYLMETFNKGYEHNRFEVEARDMERNLSILEEITIH